MWMEVMPNDPNPKNTFPPYAVGTRLLLRTVLTVFIWFMFCLASSHTPRIAYKTKDEVLFLTEHLGFAPKPSIPTARHSQTRLQL